MIVRWWMGVKRTDHGSRVTGHEVKIRNEDQLQGADGGLVSRFGDALAVAADAVDDLVGGLGPLERPGVIVPELDPVFQRDRELVERAENAAFQAAPLQFGEPSLD